jgi:hypothetical protein
MPGSPKMSLPFRYLHQNPVYASPVTHTRYTPRPSHSSRFYHRPILGEGYRSITSSLCRSLHSPVTSFLLDTNVILSNLFSDTLAYIPPMFATEFHTHTKQQANL